MHNGKLIDAPCEMQCKQESWLAVQDLIIDPSLMSSSSSEMAQTCAPSVLSRLIDDSCVDEVESALYSWMTNTRFGNRLDVLQEYCTPTYFL